MAATEKKIEQRFMAGKVRSPTAVLWQSSSMADWPLSGNATAALGRRPSVRFPESCRRGERQLMGTGDRLKSARSGLSPIPDCGHSMVRSILNAAIRPSHIARPFLSFVCRIAWDSNAPVTCPSALMRTERQLFIGRIRSNDFEGH